MNATAPNAPENTTIPTPITLGNDKQTMIELLKAAIKERSEKSKSMRREANALTGMDRHAVNCARSAYGSKTRAHLLLYAMLRGKPYIKTETRIHPTGTKYSYPGWLGNALWDLAIEFGNHRDAAIGATGGFSAVLNWLKR